jgi:hypothetical protein
MKKITKKFIGVGLGAMMVAGFALPAIAATNLTFLTVDGGTNATVTEGSTVEAKVTFDTTASTDLESMAWELVGSGLPKTCVDVADRISDGTFTSSFDVDTTGASEGTWDVRITTYGDDGADASNLCEASDQTDSQVFTDRITVVDSNNDNQDNNNNTGSHNQSALEKAIAALTALIAKLGTGGAPATTTPPTTSTACTEYSSLSMGLSQGSDTRPGGRVGQLQSFLMYKGFSIPLLSANQAPYGYFGVQTQAAVFSFVMANHC